MFRTRGWRGTLGNLSLGAAIYSAAKGWDRSALAWFGAWLVIDGCATMVRLTSRPEDMEGWHAVKNLLHTEGHLVEMIGQCKPGSRRHRLVSVLDGVRGERQALAKRALKDRFGGRVPPSVESSWCSVKHLLTTEGHLEEMIENAARAGIPCDDLAEQLTFCRSAREEILRVGTDGECLRCKDDLR